MTSMQVLVDSKDFNRLAVNDDTMDPLCENDFNFTQTKVDYENHSPLHDDDTDPFNETGEGVETGDDGEDGNDVEDELLIVSEEEAIIGEELEEEEESGIRVVTHLHDYKEEEMLSARIDEDHSSEQEQEEGEDFDESHVYRELAKMEIAEKEECTVSLASEAEHSEEEIGTCAGKEEDVTGRPVRLYATPRNQLVYTIGKMQISHSQAKLFHLFDKNGEINVENIKNKSRENSDKNYDTESYKKTFSRVKALANHRCVDTTLVDEEIEKELTFQPARSKQAEMAMKNKSCGYDFVDRLKANGEFLTRNTDDNKTLKTKNLNIELLKADYAALLNKLICPSCKNEQTFDENYEKIRECRRCSEKYVKAKTSNCSSFERTNKENEEKRLMRLKCIEDGIYGKIGQMPLKLGYPGKLKQKIINSANIENSEIKLKKFVVDDNKMSDMNNENKNSIKTVNENRNKMKNNEMIVNNIQSTNIQIEKERKSKFDASNNLKKVEVKNTNCSPDKKSTSINPINSNKTKINEENFDKKIVMKKKKSGGNASNRSTRGPPAYELPSDSNTTTTTAVKAVEVEVEVEVVEDSNCNFNLENHLSMSEKFRRMVS